MWYNGSVVRALDIERKRYKCSFFNEDIIALTALYVIVIANFFEPFLFHTSCWKSNVTSEIAKKLRRALRWRLVLRLFFLRKIPNKARRFLPSLFQKLYCWLPKKSTAESKLISRLDFGKKKPECYSGTSWTNADYDCTSPNPRIDTGIT